MSSVGGPFVFLLGNLLFKRVVFGEFPRSHVAGLVLLALGLPAIGQMSLMTLSIYATAALTFAGAWENIAVRRQWAGHCV